MSTTDRPFLSLREVAWLIGIVFVGAIAWQDVRASIDRQDREIETLKADAKENARTLAAICEALDCYEKGMIR